MQRQVLNYRIIVEPEKVGKETAYNAYCPALGLADHGSSIDEAIRNIRSLMKFHIECLLGESQEVPKENTIEEIITSAKVFIEKTGARTHVLLG